MKKDIAWYVKERPSFRIVGIKTETTNQKKAGTRAIPALWHKIMEDGMQPELLSYGNQDPDGLFGISVYNVDPQDAKRFDYYIGTASTKEAKEWMASFQIPACTWAVFPCTKQDLAKVQVQAIMKYLPKSKYRAINKGYITGKMKAPFPDIEYYLDDERVELWVAVEPKKA